MKSREHLEKLKKQNVAELNREIKELREKMARLKLEHRMQKLADFSQIKKTKRSLARALTELNSRRKEEK